MQHSPPYSGDHRLIPRLRRSDSIFGRKHELCTGEWTRVFFCSTSVRFFTWDDSNECDIDLLEYSYERVRGFLIRFLKYINVGNYKIGNNYVNNSVECIIMIIIIILMRRIAIITRESVNINITQE